MSSTTTPSSTQPTIADLLAEIRDAYQVSETEVQALYAESYNIVKGSFPDEPENVIVDTAILRTRARTFDRLRLKASMHHKLMLPYAMSQGFSSKDKTQKFLKLWTIVGDYPDLSNPVDNCIWVDETWQDNLQSKISNHGLLKLYEANLYERKATKGANKGKCNYNFNSLSTFEPVHPIEPYTDEQMFNTVYKIKNKPAPQPAPVTQASTMLSKDDEDVRRVYGFIAKDRGNSFALGDPKIIEKATVDSKGNISYHEMPVFINPCVKHAFDLAHPNAQFVYVIGSIRELADGYTSIQAVCLLPLSLSEARKLP